MNIENSLSCIECAGYFCIVIGLFLLVINVLGILNVSTNYESHGFDDTERNIYLVMSSLYLVLDILYIYAGCLLSVIGKYKDPAILLKIQVLFVVLTIFDFWLLYLLNFGSVFAIIVNLWVISYL